MKRDTVKDAWLKGIESASMLPTCENPYPKGTILHETWLMVWRPDGLVTSNARNLRAKRVICS